MIYRPSHSIMLKKKKKARPSISSFLPYFSGHESYDVFHGTGNPTTFTLSSSLAVSIVYTGTDSNTKF